MRFFRRAKEERPTVVLRVGQLNPVTRFDPRDAQDVVSAIALVQIFETPYLPTDDGSTAPRLFEGPLSDGGSEEGRQVLVGKVRSGIEFSDGTALTGRIVAESLASAESFRSQADVEATGDTLRFVLKRPNSRFDLVLTNLFTAIVLEKGGELLGTGAYKLAADATPENLRLVKNPRFRREVAIDEVVFAYYPPNEEGRPESLIAALEAEEVHLTNALSRDDVGGLRQVRKHFQPGTSTAALYFNTEKPYFATAEVRRAVATAIDRGALTRISYENALAFAASSLLPQDMGAWRDNHRPSAEQARELLDATGVSLPARLSLLLPWGPRPYLPHPRQIAVALGQQLATLGVQLEHLEPKDGQDFYYRVARSEYDLTLIGWIADTTDPADFLEANLSSKAIPEVGKSPAIRANMARWRSSRADAALAALRADPTEENKQAVLELVASEMPCLPIMYGPSIWLHSWSVRNFEPTSIGYPLFDVLALDQA